MEFLGTKGKWVTRIGSVVTSVYCGETQICLRANAKQEAQANALLISKAPELLEDDNENIRLLEICCMNLKDLNFKDFTFLEVLKDKIKTSKQLIKEATEL